MLEINRIIYSSILVGRSYLKHVHNIRAHIKLNRKKNDQKIIFSAFSKNFYKLYNAINRNVDPKFILPLWNNYNLILEKKLLPVPTFSFLRIPEIMYSMFGTRGGKLMNSELSYLKTKYPEKKLKGLLEEDYVGNPLILNESYLTSHSRIHHLYHITKFLEKTKVKMHSINSIVEWGGGYGGMAKLFWLLKEKEMTYIMIDIPLFSMLQWIYLCTILGKSNVNLLVKNTDKIEKGKINIVPLSMLRSISIHGDLFVSTWALSESSKYSQDYVVGSKWFGAKHLLLAFQKSNENLPFADKIKILAKKDKATVFPIEHISGSYYAFK